MSRLGRWIGLGLGGGAAQASAAPASRAPSDDRWFEPMGARSLAGETVTLDRALRLPVVFACLKVLSETVGSLPFAVFERTGTARRKATNHPLLAALERPNEETTSFEFFGQMVFDLASAGNFFAETKDGALGPFTELRHLPPAEMVVERLTDGGRRYRHRPAGRPERIIPADRVWHVRDLPILDGLVGMSRIDAGRDAIGQALGLQRYASDFWRNDMTPPFVILTAAPFKDAASRGNYMRALRAWLTGANRGGPAVLDHAEKVVTVGTTNEQAQFLETRKEQAYDLARIWRMQPHKVGLLERATNNNIEHQSLEFVMDTLRPWLELIERSIEHWLIIDPRKYFFEFNVAGLLRGDIKSRYESYGTARQWGWLSINEIRALENMNPIDEGDEHLEPMNMRPAGSPAAPAPAAALLGPDGAMVSRLDGGLWRRAAPRPGAALALELAS